MRFENKSNQFDPYLAATKSRATLSTDCVNFIDKENRGGIVARQFKHVADSCGAHSDEHFLEFGTIDRDKCDTGLE